MNCCKNLSALFLVLTVSCSLTAQQTDFLRFISGKVVAVDKNSFQLRVVFEIKPGLHIQSNNPESDAVIPTSINLELPEGLIMDAPHFPQPETMYLEGSDQPLQVFSGKIKIAIPITHHQPTQRPHHIAGTIHYQACDDKRCFYPRELVFVVNLKE